MLPTGNFLDEYTPQRNPDMLRHLNRICPIPDDATRRKFIKFEHHEDVIERNPRLIESLNFLPPSLNDLPGPSNPGPSFPPLINQRLTVDKFINPWNYLRHPPKRCYGASVPDFFDKQILIHFTPLELMPPNVIWTASDVIARDANFEKSINDFEKTFFVPNYKTDSAKNLSLTQKRADCKNYHVQRILSIWHLLSDHSTIYRNIFEATSEKDRDEGKLSEIMEKALLDHIGASNRDQTLKGDACQLNRFQKFLIDNHLDQTAWNFANLYKMIKDDQAKFMESGKLRPTSFKNLMRVIRKYTKLWGLSLITEDQLTILDRMATLWRNDHMALVRRAAPLSHKLLAAIEQLLVHAKVIINTWADKDTAEMDKSPLHVSLSTYLFAFTLRLFCGAAVRWGDGLCAKPSNAHLMAEGIVANGEMAKNRNKAQGRPWASCAAPLMLDTKNWLSRGWGIFSALPDHATRDYWISIPLGDNRSFLSSVPADWNTAKEEFMNVAKLLGFHDEAAVLRPHCTKVTGINALVLKAAADGTTNSREIMVMGDYNSDTAENMALVYTRNGGAVALKGSSSVILHNSEKGADILFNETIQENINNGIASAAEKSSFSLPAINPDNPIFKYRRLKPANPDAPRGDNPDVETPSATHANQNETKSNQERKNNGPEENLPNLSQNKLDFSLSVNSERESGDIQEIIFDGARYLDDSWRFDNFLVPDLNDDDLHQTLSNATRIDDPHGAIRSDLYNYNKKKQILCFSAEELIDQYNFFVTNADVNKISKIYTVHFVPCSCIHFVISCKLCYEMDKTTGACSLDASKLCSVDPEHLPAFCVICPKCADGIIDGMDISPHIFDLENIEKIHLQKLLPIGTPELKKLFNKIMKNKSSSKLKRII